MAPQVVPQANWIPRAGEADSTRSLPGSHSKLVSSRAARVADSKVPPRSNGPRTPCWSQDRPRQRRLRRRRLQGLDSLLGPEILLLELRKNQKRRPLGSAGLRSADVPNASIRAPHGLLASPRSGVTPSYGRDARPKERTPGGHSPVNAESLSPSTRSKCLRFRVSRTPSLTMHTAAIM